MIIIALLAALAITGLVATIVELRRDGFRPVTTDWTRVAERDSRADAGSSITYR